MIRLRRGLAALVVLLAVPSAVAGARDTTRSRYVVRTLAEGAGGKLTVTSGSRRLRVTSNGRLIVPARWRRQTAAAGQLRFLARQNANCGYDLRYSVRSVIAPAQAAGDHVAAALPGPGGRYLIDSGERRDGAFRVVRQRKPAGRIRLEGLWAGVLTKRADIVPGGSAAWTEIRVIATSRAGDECHAGTYRDALGPAIGDTLAVARNTMRFTAAG